MASASAVTLLPSAFDHEGKTHLRLSPAHTTTAYFGSLGKLSLPASAAAAAAANRVVSGKRRYQVVAKAVGEDSDSESIVKFVKDAWKESDDRIALVGLGFTGIVALWAIINLVGAIDRLPLIPGVFEFIGVLYSWWFAYRYLLFKPDRAELVEKVKRSLSDVLGN